MQKSKRTSLKRKSKPSGGAKETQMIRPSVFRMSSAVLRHLNIPEKGFERIRDFVRLEGLEKVRAARRIIEETVINAGPPNESIFALAVAESESLLSGYATLDEPHRAAIESLIQQITSYLRDTSRQRPFNALMLASPGAGKSHFIKQLASKMNEDRVQAVTFNMATMQTADDMAQPIDELRNLKVNDRFPLLFLDEIDSDPSRYAALLPLLWDGELLIGHRDLKLGKAVIVLAGSSPDLPKVKAQSATMRLDAESAPEAAPTGKLVDLLSRINGGVIEIPDLDLHTAQRDRRIDKVCITVGLVRLRFGKQLETIPRSLLRFAAHTKFRYGVRSIAHLVDLIDRNSFQRGSLVASKLGLPISSEKALEGSSLPLHLLDKEQGFGIVNRWKEYSEDKVALPIKPNRMLPWEIFSRNF